MSAWWTSYAKLTLNVKCYVLVRTRGSRCTFGRAPRPGTAGRDHIQVTGRGPTRRLQILDASLVLERDAAEVEAGGSMGPADGRDAVGVRLALLALLDPGIVDPDPAHFRGHPREDLLGGARPKQLTPTHQPGCRSTTEWWIASRASSDMPWLMRRKTPSDPASRATWAFLAACSSESTWMTGSTTCRRGKTRRSRSMGASNVFSDSPGFRLRSTGRPGGRRSDVLCPPDTGKAVFLLLVHWAEVLFWLASADRGPE